MAQFEIGTVEALIGCIIEVFLYGKGIFLPIAFACALVLYRRSRNGIVNHYLVITFSLLFVLVTTRFVTDVERTVHTWTHPNASGQISYGSLASYRSVLTNCVTVLETVIADAFLVYRAWAVYRGNYRVVILPALCVAVTLGGGSYSLHLQTQYQSEVDLNGILHAVVIYLYATLCGNSLCTALIAYKVLTIQRMVSGRRYGSNQQLWKFITILVESAAFYNTLVLVQIVTIHLELYVAYVFQAMTPAAIGLVFGLIILRASEGKAFGDTPLSDSASYTKALPPRNQLFELRSRMTENGDPQERMHVSPDSLQIRLEKVIETRVDSVARDELDDRSQSDKDVPDSF